MPKSLKLQTSGDEVSPSLADRLLPGKVLLTVDDLVPLLPRGTSTPSRYRFVHGLPSGLIKRVGGRTYVSRTALIEWLDNRSARDT